MADPGAIVRSAPASASGREVRPLVRHPGNEELFQALAWSVAGVRRGWPLHVHVEGLRGTGKTTIVRDFRRHLPRIRRVRGCLFHCDPDAPHCPDHRGLSREELAAVGEEWVTAPFLEVSASAKIGTLVGSIDLARVVDRDRPDARLLPGTLAQAHRGVVFVDEINRLADTAPELADALLDVMGTKPGRLQIEETGLPRVVLPASVTVWAASNPDEEPGPLADVRRQLADRFDLVVAMQRPASVEIVRRILAGPERVDASNPGDAPAPAGGAASGWPAVSEAQRDFLASAYVRFQLESLRAVEAWQAAARLAAECRQSERVGSEDLLATAAPVLRHRVEPEALPEILAYARERLAPGAPAEDDLESALATAGAASAGAAAAKGAAAVATGVAAAERSGEASGGEPTEEAGASAAGAAPRTSAAARGRHPDDGVPPWSRLFLGWRVARGSVARQGGEGAAAASATGLGPTDERDAGFASPDGAPSRGAGHSHVADPRDTAIAAPRHAARHLADWDAAPLWKSDHVDHVDD